MLREAVVGEIVCISLPDRPHEPWMIGELQHAPLPATEADVAEAKALGFTVKVGASVLRLTKYEPFEFGSRKFIQPRFPWLCHLVVCVVTSCSRTSHVRA